MEHIGLTFASNWMPLIDEAYQVVVSSRTTPDMR